MNSELLFCYLHVVTVLILLLKIEINLINYDVSKVNLKLVNQKRISINTAVALSKIFFIPLTSPLGYKPLRS